MDRSPNDRSEDTAPQRRSVVAIPLWIPITVFVVLAVIVVVAMVAAHLEVSRKELASGEPLRTATPNSNSATPGKPLAKINRMFVAGPRALTGNYQLSMIFVAERWPFPNVPITPDYVRAHVSQTLAPKTEYIVLFFAPETGEKVKSEEWLRIRDAVLGVRDDRVLGIIENRSQKLTVFKKRGDIVRKLKSLRKEIQARYSGAPAGSVVDGTEGDS